MTAIDRRLVRAAHGARRHPAVPMGHRVPRSTASWAYVFGSATLILFVMQIVTGICLALVYVPSADQAFESLEYLNYEAALGWYLRAVHFWGSNAMVLVMTLHMIQVFLWGAHKYPRELTWVVGVLLFLCTLGMAFTGQILRWDQDAYWGLGIGTSIIGPGAVRGIGAGARCCSEGRSSPARTLSRFFTLHVFVIPGLLIGLVGLHLWLVLTARHQRVADARTAGRSRDLPRSATRKRSRRTACPSSRWRPARTWSAWAWSSSPCWSAPRSSARTGRTGIPNPTIIDTVPKPDFYFLSLYAAVRAAAALDGDGRPSARPSPRYRVPAAWFPSSPGRARRAGGAGRSPCSAGADPPDDRDAGLARRRRALVSGHGRLERRSHARAPT